MKNMLKFDFLIIGAGLTGATYSYELNKKGFKCLVLDSRNHIGGNCYDEKIDDILVHKYGPHIFHTNNKEIWDYVNKLDEFIPFINQPLVKIGNKVYNLPFNMNLFYQVFKEYRPNKIKMIINKEIKKYGVKNPKNFEEFAISQIGITLYQMFIKGYTEKQWGVQAKKLPNNIFKRLPLRFIFDNNYYDDDYQGLPKNGYSFMIKKMLENSKVILNYKIKNINHLRDFLKNIKVKKVIFTGMIDEFFNYIYGKLNYRSLKFKIKKLNIDNYQGNAVVNYSKKKIPYTRIVEYKHFYKQENLPYTIIGYEYPIAFNKGKIPYYPVNLEKDKEIYDKYKNLSLQFNIIFKGRLAEYKYFDMDDIINNVLGDFKNFNILKL